MSRGRAARTPWLKVGLIAAILYVAGILGPLGAFVWAVQRDVVLAGWSTGNALVLVAAVAVALGIGVCFGVVAWLKRLAARV